MRLFTIWLPIAIIYRFKKFAKMIGSPASQIVEAFIVDKAMSVNLTSKDYEDIAKLLREKKSKN